MRIVFVCQAGSIEREAALLAASLRSVIGSHIHLVAAIPNPPKTWGDLRPVTHFALNTLNVERLPVHNIFGRTYPVANKIAALIGAGDVPVLLLDSDILCLSAPPVTSLLENVDVAAKPADGLSFNPGDRQWASIYRSRGLEPPLRRLITTVSGQLTSPYFNAGVVYTRAGRTLGMRWMETCHGIQREAVERQKFYWLDQIALPLAIQSLGWTFKTLTEKWNYPAEFKPLMSQMFITPIFAHYHRPRAIEGNDILLGHIRHLLQTYPWLCDAIDDDNGPWRRIIEKCRLDSTRANDVRFLITGPPCSGTPLLQSMLSSELGCAIVDEPRRVLQHRSITSFRRALTRLYSELPCDLENVELAHTPTTSASKHSLRSIPINNSGMPLSTGTPKAIVGTSSTLGYLSRLSFIRRDCDDIRVLVCMRDPRTAIREWTRRFRYLATADIPSLQSDLVPQTLEDMRELGRIAVSQDVRVRRALLWRYMANIVAQNRLWITVLRYEDLAAAPDMTLAYALEVLGVEQGAEVSDFNVNSMLTSRECERADDCVEDQMIADICGEKAEVFGYLL